MTLNVTEHTHLRESKYERVEVAECISRVLSNTPLPDKSQAILVEISNAKNHILAEDIYAPHSIPSHPTSIMDGYAVISSDGPGKYPVVQILVAGNTAMKNLKNNKESSKFNMNPKLKSGSVAYITTGGILPDGADAVIPVEQTKLIDENTVQILVQAKSRQKIREIGSDITKNELILKKGTLITSNEIGILCHIGKLNNILVYKKATIGVLSSGDELIDPLTSSKDSSNIKDKYSIFDSNRPMLSEHINSLGYCKSLDFGISKDNEMELKKKILLSLSKCDILITSGGVSMGSRDYIKPILSKIGKILFGRMLMKPGLPTTVCVINNFNNIKNNNKLIFALPGNPVSCLVTFKLIVLGSIKKLSGLNKSKYKLAPIHAELLQDIRCDPVRPEYHRSIIYYDKFKKRFLALSTGFQRSSRIMSILNCNCLLRIPKGNEILKKGSMVKGLVIDNLIPDMPPKITNNKIIERSNNECNCGVSHKEEEHKHSQDHNKHKHKHNISDNIKYKHITEHKNINAYNVGVLTVSDRAYNGIYKDLSGPAVISCLNEFSKNSKNKMSFKFNNSNVKIINDNKNNIKNILNNWVSNNSNKCDIIFTSGGTGCSSSDVTPEATKEVIEKECFGLVIAMMNYSLKQTSFAALSRYTAGIVNKTLIVNLPGKPKAVKECLQVILPLLNHCMNQIKS